jgi:RNA polymerase sigma factor (sigma-70 family)
MSTDRITCEIARSAPTQRRPCPPVSRRNDVTALVHGAAAGEERAWALLVGRFDATIHAVARCHRLSVADQDDVAQTTWLKLVVHVKQIKHRAALGGWLTTTAQRECLRVLEAAQRELPVNEPIVADRPDGTSVEDEAAAGERRDALHRALEGAPAHERMLVRLLLDAPALSYDDVSAALGIPKGTIGPTRGRCIARLRNDRHLAGVVGSHATARATGRRPTPGHDLS